MKKIIHALIITLLLFQSKEILAQLPNYIPINGLVAYYPFNVNANDESGNSNNGTINGATLTTDRLGIANTAYSFDGVNDYFSATLQAINTNYTLSFWYYSSVTTFGMNLFEHSNGYLVTAASQKLDYAQFTSSGNQILTSVSSYSTNSWSNIVVVFNGTGNQKDIYINGTLDNSQITTGTITSITSLIMAKRPNNTGYFNGKLDDIGIWNRVLSPLEIQTLYSSCNIIATQPTSLTTNKNSNAILSSTSNVTTATFKWQSNSNNMGWLDVPSNAYYTGTNTTSLTINNVQLGNHLQPFRVIAETNTCKDTSNIALLHISDTCITTITVTHTTSVTVHDTLVIDVNLTGIAAPNNINRVKIYPNPTNDHITLHFGNFATMNNYTIKIKNNLGQEVYSAPVTQQTEYIDLNSWTGNGLYFVHIIDAQSNTIDIKKIVLQ